MTGDGPWRTAVLDGGAEIFLAAHSRASAIGMTNGMTKDGAERLRARSKCGATLTSAYSPGHTIAGSCTLLFTNR